MQQATGVLHAVSGFTGGHLEKPTYEQVCRGDSGHIEAVEVLFDPRQTTYETLAKLYEMGYDYVTVEPNTWRRQETEIKTVGSQQVVLVHADMDEELAYALTKGICEGAAVLGEAVAAMKYFNPETAGSLQLTGVALHPGAVRYFAEMGYPVK